MNFDISSWDKRNVGVLPSGELCVAESYYELKSWSLDGTILFGSTVRCQTTDVVWHYIVWQRASDSHICLTIQDENFVDIQVYDYGIVVSPSAVTFSIVEDQMMICSPDLPAVWGVVGSGVVLATSVASVNPNTTAIANIPRGLSVSWAGRCIIASRETLFFSDALYPRTFTGENTIDPPGGAIYGLHVSAGGALVVCTTSGVYTLPEDAASIGQIVLGVFSKITDYECFKYNTTCCVHGRVYGLTKKGFRLIDQQGTEETLLDEQVNSVYDGRIHYNDYRDNRIGSSIYGPFVITPKHKLITDLASKLRAWEDSNLYTASNFLVKDVLYENDGAELYLTSTNVQCRNGNNEDNSTADNLSGSIMGRIVLPPEKSPVVRGVTFASNSHESFSVRIRDTLKSVAPKQFSPIVGTDEWDKPIKYIEPRLQSRYFRFAHRGDDLVFALYVVQNPYLIPSVMDVEFKGPGKKRDTN